MSQPLADGVGVARAEHFESIAQQRAAATLGIWAWLITELLLFSALFLVALITRIQHPEATVAAAKHLKFWIGATNTVVLICSSLTMSMAIEFSRMGWQRAMVRAMLATAAALPAQVITPPVAGVTAPSQGFPTEPGSDYYLANYDAYEAYLKKLASQSDRMKLVDIGKSAEGRTMWMAIVSTPANLAKLDRYRDIARRLKTPRRRVLDYLEPRGLVDPAEDLDFPAPDPDELERRKAEIRAEWSEKERRKRLGPFAPRPIELSPQRGGDVKRGLTRSA